MLKQLTIQNFALIKDLRFEPSKGFNTITGETGAGKSILLGAMSLILGERADHSMLFNTDEKCVVEATFNLSNLDLQLFFQEYDLDYESETILRREISPTGRNRMFVNDTPITLTTLRELGTKLVDIHSQNQSLDIKSPTKQLWIVDQMADNQVLLADYQLEYKSYKKLQNQLKEIEEALLAAKRETDYHQFLFDELEKMNWQPGEEVSLEDELKQLVNSEEIVSKCTAVSSGLNGEHSSICDQIEQLIHELKEIGSLHSGVQSIKSKIAELNIDLRAYAQDLEQLANNTEMDEQRLQEINERFDALNSQMKKHGARSANDLLTIQADLSDKLEAVGNQSADSERIEKEIEESERKLHSLAQELRENRSNMIIPFQEMVEKELRPLGMPSAKFEIELNENKDLGPNGMDEVWFKFSSNTGIETQAIQKAASGGEMSRIVFAFKRLLSTKLTLPTIIFDEIDTGVSGEVASKMGQKMKEMSSTIQLISITHLPQVASKGDKHFYVYKEEGELQTHTYLKELNEDERVDELAKMLSGEQTTFSATEQAKELMKE